MSISLLTSTTRTLRVLGSRSVIASSSSNKYRPFCCPSSMFLGPYSFSLKPVPKKMPSALAPLFEYVDKNVESYKNLLKEAVAIPSVSSDIKHRDDCIRMVEWMRDKLKEVGATVELRDIGFQTLEGQEVKLPPVLVGVLGNVSNLLR